MKKYGGCLSFLLPLWIVGQLISLVTNITVMCHQEEQSYVPMIFIVTNIVAIIGIILLLNYKKWGFYALVFSCILSFSVGVIYPDDVNSGFAFKSFLCLVFFLLLLCFKNKETQKNGYQTLGLFEFATINVEKTEAIIPTSSPSAPPAPTKPILFISPESITDMIAEKVRIEIKVRRTV